MNAIKQHDSERLIKNKIKGFIIAIQDKLFELKPKLKCNGSGRAADNSSQISHTPMSGTRTTSNILSDSHSAPVNRDNHPGAPNASIFHKQPVQDTIDEMSQLMKSRVSSNPNNSLMMMQSGRNESNNMAN